MKINLSVKALAALLSLAFVAAPVTVHAQTSAPATTPAPAAAPAKAAKKTNKVNYSGDITAIDTTANTVTFTSAVKKDAGKSLTIAISATTKITKDKKPATLADFKVGDKITGSYAPEASGTLTAATLNTGAAAAKSKKKAAAPAAQ